jgi:hypothetical protein
VVTIAGALAVAAPAQEPKIVGTLNAQYTLQVSGEKGLRTAHDVAPVDASLFRALMSGGLWEISLLGPNGSIGPRCSLATYCSDGEPTIKADASADITFLGLRAVMVADSPRRRKWILSGSVRTTGSGLISEVDFDRWRCQGGGLPTSGTCLLEATGSQIDAPTPIEINAGEQVSFTVEITVTNSPWHYKPSKVSTKIR